MPAPRLTIDQLPTDDAVVGTEWLVIQDGTTTKKTAVSTLTGAATVGLDAHIAAAADAHDASAISATPSGPIDGASVQAQLGQLATATGSLSTADTALNNQISDHLTDTVDAHDATAISLAPPAGMASVDVQSVVSELKALVDALDARVVVLETP